MGLVAFFPWQGGRACSWGPPGGEPSGCSPGLSLPVVLSAARSCSSSNMSRKLKSGCLNQKECDSLSTGDKIMSHCPGGPLASPWRRPV